MNRLERFLFVSHTAVEMPIANQSQDWHRQLARENLPKLTSPQEVTNAGELTYAMMRGILNTYSEDKTRIYEIECPRVFIVSPTKKTPSLAVSNVRDNEIYVRKDFLALYAQLEQSQGIIINYDQEKAFYGSVQEYFELVGAEETHHTTHPEFYSVYSLTHTTLAEHDSHSTELVALEWKIKYAQQHNFSQTTKDDLQKRYKNTLRLIGEFDPTS